jgi:hypothetical protein
VLEGCTVLAADQGVMLLGAGKMNVPKPSKAFYRGHPLFLWPGLDPTGQATGLFQPVLTLGPRADAQSYENAFVVTVTAQAPAAFVWLETQFPGNYLLNLL